MCKTTVLMPVFNAAAYLSDAIDSVLEQSFTDFEFLIIDDGSTDDSVAIIQSYADARIRLVRNETNLGVVNSLNRGLTLCRGEYIARMDSDDVCLPARLQKQVTFLDHHPTVGVCGSWACSMDGSIVWKMPVYHHEIVAHLLLNNAFVHPSVMIRRSLIIEHNLTYRCEDSHAEDYGLWVRTASVTILANIPEILLKYRVHQGQVSNGFREIQLETAGVIRTRVLGNMKVILPSRDKAVLDEIGSSNPTVTREFLFQASRVFEKILLGRGEWAQHGPLSRLLARTWLDLYRRCNQRGLRLSLLFLRCAMRFLLINFTAQLRLLLA